MHWYYLYNNLAILKFQKVIIDPFNNLVILKFQRVIIAVLSFLWPFHGSSQSFPFRHHSHLPQWYCHRHYYHYCHYCCHHPRHFQNHKITFNLCNWYNTVTTFLLQEGSRVYPTARIGAPSKIILWRMWCRTTSQKTLLRFCHPDDILRHLDHTLETCAVKMTFGDIWMTP